MRSNKSITFNINTKTINSINYNNLYKLFTLINFMKNHSNRSVSLDNLVWSKIDDLCKKNFGAKYSTVINVILRKHLKIKGAKNNGS